MTAAPPGPLRALLVEDSADDAELVLLELKRGGFQVTALRVDSLEAMARALAGAAWDLVISDYRIPGFGGMAALQALQDSGLDLPFILVSGAIGEEVAAAAMKSGAHDYVLKHNLVRLCPTVARELRDAAARREQRQALEDLRLSEGRNRDLQRDLDRLAAKGQMAAYVAHEINNPLAGIKNAFALLEPAIPADHPHRRYAELIKREIDRIAGIIRTMYHVYRPPSSELGEVPLREAFQDIQSLMLPKCRAAGVLIELDLQDPGLRVRFNEGMLRQVVFNLAQNAVEASPEVTVRDQGPGIPPEWAARVFEQGFTSKHGPGMSGLGLGLGTCKSLVEAMGGTLGFAPGAGGKGCIFTVRLADPPPGPATQV